MKVIVSAHLDTVFNDPMGTIEDGQFIGPCDNIASVLAVGKLLGETDVKIELTNDEEGHMDGARYVSRENDPKTAMMIVLDVTEDFKKSVNFTVENVYGINMVHVKKALRPFKGKYKFNEKGEESEAWLYRDMGFPVLEIDIPVRDGIHNMKAVSRVEDILVVADVLKALIAYFKDMTREQLSDQFKVEANHE
jgi:hypothetical protein